MHGKSLNFMPPKNIKQSVKKTNFVERYEDYQRNWGCCFDLFNYCDIFDVGTGGCNDSNGSWGANRLVQNKKIMKLQPIIA